MDYIKAPLNIENDHLIGSSLHIKQILQNIVSNAVKYNKRGGYVRVSCTENRIDEKNIMFEFVCTDNGQGMSEDFQKKTGYAQHMQEQVWVLQYQKSSLSRWEELSNLSADRDMEQHFM